MVSAEAASMREANVGRNGERPYIRIGMRRRRAVLFADQHLCFLIPPLLGLGTLVFRMTAYEGDVR